jgi:ubiquinone biosynthesis protein
VLGLDAIGHTLRLARAGFVLAREGAFVGLEDAAPPTARLPLHVANLIARRGAGRSEALANAMVKLGPSYVKLGQFLSTRPDLVGAKTAVDLERLQDRVAPEPRAVAVAAIEQAFGQPITTLFAEFGEPVAAASVAQVHRAKLHADAGGKDVAVKVLRTGVERRFARDLSDMAFAAHVAERLDPSLARLKLSEVVATVGRSVRMEMDLRLEAAAASEFRENLDGDSDFRAPAVDWDRTTREVMTMEWIDATPLGDPGPLAALGHDPKRLARALIQGFLRHALAIGFFHADMHQGNVMVDADGRIALVDFGIMGRLGRVERKFLAEVLYGFIKRDYYRVAELHIEIGYVSSRFRVEDFAQAIRAIGEPIHSRPAHQISMARLLTLLFEVTALFDMATRVELVMLQKTMVVVEGVARKLDPELNIWSTAEPVVGAWIARNLGPTGRIEDFVRNLREIARHLEQAPKILENLKEAAEKAAETEDIVRTDASSFVHWMVTIALTVATLFLILHR